MPGATKRSDNMATWSHFTHADPELAAFGRERLSGGVAYLATTRADGGPRVHPVTPIIGGERLYIYMEPTSPKGHDLRRDGRFALHSAVENADGGGGEFLIHGRAEPITDPDIRAACDALAPYEPRDRYILFELHLGRVLATVYEGGETVRRRWRAESVNADDAG
jgi:hypothetical protein